MFNICYIKLQLIRLPLLEPWFILNYYIEMNTFLRYARLLITLTLVNLGVYGITVQPFYGSTLFQFNQNVQPEIEEEIHHFTFEVDKNDAEIIGLNEVEESLFYVDELYTPPNLNTEIKPPIA